MTVPNVLLIDNDNVIRSSLKTFLENHNYKVCEAGSVKEAIKNDLKAFNVVVTDIATHESPGTEIIRLASGVPVIVTSAQASLRSAVSIMKLGAADYLAKPYDYDDLLRTIEDVTRDEIAAIPIEMLGQCAEVQLVGQQICKVAPTDSNVLIQGESGTGKELVARKIHALSDRARRQIVSLNCAAIPDTLIESELFGHEKGAFSGATADRVGLVEAADQSTLFLDEIGELPMSAQGRLLRVLQDGEVRRVGSIDTRKVSVRLITSTHRNLQSLVAEGSFREDLYYRLNVVTLSLPPLRDRGDDLALLAKHFLAALGERHGKTPLKFKDATLRLIKSYRWPGNIREMENAIQRAVILADTRSIGPELLAIKPDHQLTLPDDDPQDDQVSLKDYFVRYVLDNQDAMTETQLAEKLGISRKSLWQKRQKLGIPRQNSRTR